MPIKSSHHIEILQGGPHDKKRLPLEGIPGTPATGFEAGPIRLSKLTKAEFSPKKCSGVFIAARLLAIEVELAELNKSPLSCGNVERIVSMAHGSERSVCVLEAVRLGGFLKFF